MCGFDFIDRLQEDPVYKWKPVIVYTAKDLTKGDEQRLSRVAQTVILKDVRSPERLVDAVSLYLHRRTASLREDVRKMVERVTEAESILGGKTVLICDDDVRNIYALTSVLERYNTNIIPAENGNEAIKVLSGRNDVDLVLMDIMMPEKDGLETMREIREMPKYKTLPIIAVTAKAMRGDRELCVEAGASDYVSKPIDTDQLLSTMCEWLYR
jgi:CheY-like chemotaxis protein